MDTPFSSQMVHPIDAIEPIRCLMDVSSLLLMLIFLIFGRCGLVRLASLGLGLLLLYVELRVSITLTSVILPPYRARTPRRGPLNSGMPPSLPPSRRP